MTNESPPTAPQAAPPDPKKALIKFVQALIKLVREFGPPVLKFMLEVGPLVIFFVLNKVYTTAPDEEAGIPGESGILTATKWFLIAAVAAFPFAWRIERKLPMMLFLSTLAIGIFGGLTWYFDNELFIKLKPTIFSAGLGLFLLVGLAMNKLFLVDLFGSTLKLTEEGWRKFTLRYSLFFLFIAALNEAVWRNVETDIWVTFKVFGILPLTFVFIMLQMGLMKRYELPDEAAGEAPPANE